MSYELGEYPTHKIVVNGSEIQGDAITVDITRRENKIADVIIKANDYKGKTFLQRIDVNDECKVYFKYEDKDNTWFQVFGGWIVQLNPGLTLAGEVCGIRGYGYGIGLKRMRVADEYGTESQNPTLDTIKEIITDATKGIIPNYVQKIFGGSASGYAFNLTKVADVGSSIKYILSPYSPATAVLQTLCDLISAQQYPNAGCHWQVLPAAAGNPYFCLATVGNHEDPPGDVWPTTATPSTIEVAKDILRSNFTKQEVEANYIVYFGKYEYPIPDVWTEQTANDWDHDSVNGDVDDVADAKVGSYSVRGYFYTTDSQFWYPKNGTLNIDLLKIGTKRTVPTLSFYGKKNDKADVVKIRLFKGDVGNADYFELDISNRLTTNKWVHVVVAVGPHAGTKEELEWSSQGSPTWDSIDHVGFYLHNTGPGTANLQVDNLLFHGIITRGAYHSGNITTNKAKIKLVTDSLAKSCILDATDDSGMIAQLAKAELIRALATPIMGRVKLPLHPLILPGQIIHVHASRTETSFHIDKNMRILEVIHHFGTDQCTTDLTLTDDVKNSFAREPTNSYNAIMKAVNPDFQDRDRGDLKGRDIDIDQTILAKDYV